MTKQQALCIALFAAATSMTGCATLLVDSEAEELVKKIKEYNRQVSEYYRQLDKYEQFKWTMIEQPLPVRLIFLVGNAETINERRKELKKRREELVKQSEQIDRKWKALLYD